jgi:hypothetical protein
VAAAPKKAAGAKAPAARPQAATQVAAAAAPSAAPVSSPARKRLSKAFSRPLDKKLRQPALVRDRYTFPESEYEVLVALKQRLTTEGFPVKKSELLRAGIMLLADLDDEQRLALLAKLRPVG